MQGRRSLDLPLFPPLETPLARYPRKNLNPIFENMDPNQPSSSQNSNPPLDQSNILNQVMTMIQHLDQRVVQSMTTMRDEIHQEIQNNMRYEENIRPHRRPMKDYYNPGFYQTRQGIRYPELEANFELKPTFLALLPSFRGQPNEDPYEHIEEFLKICDTLFVTGVPKDAIRLRAFPFNLKDKANHWCKNLDERIDNWEALKNAFLKNFFPIGKMNALRYAIESFSQQPNEHFHDAWERFKESIRKCPNHGIPKHRLIYYFYNGIDTQDQKALNASCGGYILEDDEDHTWKMIECMSDASKNSESHQTFGRYNKKIQAHAIGDDNTALLCAQIDKLQVRLDNLEKEKAQVQPHPQPQMQAQTYPHPQPQYQLLMYQPPMSEEANWVQRNQTSQTPNL